MLVGALNMDEFAYGFTTENTHYGVTQIRTISTRVAGGRPVVRRRRSRPECFR